VEEEDDIPVAPSTVEVTKEGLFDIECMICLLCFTPENPPLELVCPDHPDRPELICRNDLAWYVSRRETGKDFALNCPLCRNDIEFEGTEGKTDEEVLSLFSICEELLQRIEENKFYREAVQREMELYA